MLLTIEQIKEYVVGVVETNLSVRRVLLFGSYARGEQNEKSDVDLIIESDLQGLAFFGVVGKLAEAMPVKTDVFELREVIKPSSMFDAIIKDGIPIYERQ